MAVTESTYTGNGSTTNYSFTFPYLKTTDIKTSINGTATTAFTLANATTVQFNTAPASSAAIRIYRETDDSKLEATFFAGSAIKSSDLNDNFNQNLYVTQESNNKIDAAWTSGDETITSTETWVSNDNRVSTTAAQDARIDTKIDTALTTDVAAGNKITVTDNSPGSGQITVALTSGSLVNSDVNASAAIDGTKVDPQFGTQNVSLTGNITVSGTVDGRDVSADGTKLDGIETAATADQTNAEIRTAVEAATDSNVFTDADHSKLNAIEASATADQTDAEIRTAVEAASDSNVFTDADHSKLNAIEASATADQTIGEIKTLIAGSPLDDSHLAANSVGDSEIVTGALDNRYYTKTTADARYFNISTGDTIKDGDTFPDNDTTIATTAAINDRIIDLVDDVGGFVPIANETSFPNANPDVNNGTGTLVSIKALASNLTSNGSGVATIANGTVGNSTVTITGLANSTTYASTFGMIVETTSTLNTYTFHRQVPKATEVTTVAGSIANVNTAASNISDVNNFAELYQISTSAPSTDGGGNSLVAGDLWFDSSSNKTLKVHTGTAFQAVSPTQSVLNDISIVSGQITFSEDLGAITDSLTTGTGNNINTVASAISNVNTVAGVSANVTTVAGIASNVTSVAGAVSNINTTVSNLASINNFAEVYRIASGAPSSSLNEGDLWYDSANNILKYYNGTNWTVTAAAGLSDLIDDTTPELGGHLDCNDKNLTEVGTVSGNNLQIDFGTLS